MKKNSKNNTVPIVDEFADFFSAEPNANEKAWGLIHDFYHGILTSMKKKDVSRSDLATKMNKSRSAISQLFNKTPNITLKKMVEIAEALNQNLKISFEPIFSIVEETNNQPAKASFISGDADVVPIDAGDNNSQSLGVNSSSNLIPFNRGRARSDFNSSVSPDAATG